MAEKTVIHVMRHGEVHNPKAVLYGRLPGYHLSELGKQMVQATADYLFSEAYPAGPEAAAGPEKVLSAVITSPLERAVESGTPAAKAFGLEIQTDSRLIESGNTFEGVSIRSHPLTLANPKYWLRYVNPFRPSWGEPYTEQAQRMTAAVRSALHRYHGKNVLLVSHQLPIWTLRRHLEGKPLWHDPRRRECSLASLTTLVFDGYALSEINYSEPAAHLLTQAADMTPGSSAAAVKK